MYNSESIFTDCQFQFMLRLESLRLESAEANAVLTFKLLHAYNNCTCWDQISDRQVWCSGCHRTALDNDYSASKANNQQITGLLLSLCARVSARGSARSFDNNSFCHVMRIVSHLLMSVLCSLCFLSIKPSHSFYLSFVLRLSFQTQKHTNQEDRGDSVYEEQWFAIKIRIKELVELFLRCLQIL